MSESPQPDATQALQAISEGDRSATDQLLPIVYKELRALAGSYFRSERPGHTLQPTALVHEAFVRLIGVSDVQVTDRAHFFALAATAMRRILADHARRRGAAKRGGQFDRAALDPTVTPPTRSETDFDVESLDQALTRLAKIDERKHRVVEMRFFAGLSVEEVAQVLGVSKGTIEGDWRAARAWLKAQLSEKAD